MIKELISWGALTLAFAILCIAFIISLGLFSMWLGDALKDAGIG